MNKTVRIIFVILLAAILLLSFPFLFVFLNGAIIGSYEWFPRPEDIATKRMIYIFISFMILIVDTIVIVKLIRLIKSIRSE